jgi:hypothetical protein
MKRAPRGAFGRAFRRAFSAALSCEFPVPSHQFPVCFVRAFCGSSSPGPPFAISTLSFPLRSWRSWRPWRFTHFRLTIDECRVTGWGETPPQRRGDRKDRVLGFRGSRVRVGRRSVFISVGRCGPCPAVHPWLPERPLVGPSGPCLTVRPTPSGGLGVGCELRVSGPFVSWCLCGKTPDKRGPRG